MIAAGIFVASLAILLIVLGIQGIEGTAGSKGLWVVLIVFVASSYLLPSINVTLRQHRNTSAILVLNLAIIFPLAAAISFGLITALVLLIGLAAVPLAIGYATIAMAMWLGALVWSATCNVKGTEQ